MRKQKQQLGSVFHSVKRGEREAEREGESECSVVRIARIEIALSMRFNMIELT